MSIEHTLSTSAYIALFSIHWIKVVRDRERGDTAVGCFVVPYWGAGAGLSRTQSTSCANPLYLSSQSLTVMTSSSVRNTY